MNKKIWLVLFFAMLLILPGIVYAYDVKKGDSVLVGKNETIDGNLFAAGSSIQVDGHIKGDVFCAGQTVSITGPVDGNIYCAGQTISVSGKIAGDLIAAGQAMNVQGAIGKNLIFAGQTVSTHASSTIGWQALLAVASANLAGPINHDLLGAGGSFSLGNTIGRNVNLWLDNGAASALTLSPSANIKGGLTYHAPREADIRPGAKVAGKIDFQELAAKTKTSSRGNWLGAWIFGALSSFVIGLFFISIWPAKTKRLLASAVAGSRRNFGWGLLITLLLPLFGILLLFTLIGIPLTFLLILIWFAGMWLGKLLTVGVIGVMTIEKWWPAKKESLYWQLAAGVTICYLLFSIPILGGILAFLATIYGFGTIYLHNHES